MTQGKTESKEHHREVQESETSVVWPHKEARPRIHRKKDSGCGSTWEKKRRKTEAEMDRLCQPRNCVCRSDPAHKWERLEEEEDLSDEQGRDVGSEEGTGKEIGGRRNAATTGVLSCKAGQDKK